MALYQDRQVSDKKIIFWFAQNWAKCQKFRHVTLIKFHPKILKNEGGVGFLVMPETQKVRIEIILIAI